MNQKGVVSLAVPFLFLLALAAVLFILISRGLIKLPSKVSVELQKQYQNPFDKNTQYVNPFSSYKNPFDQLK